MKPKLQLLPDERVMLRSDQDILLLTNKRVRYSSVTTGQTMRIGITLDSVASCAIIAKSHIIYLILGGLAGSGAVNADDTLRIGLFLAAVALVAAFFLTRKSMLSISSNGGDKINVPIKGMSADSVNEFLEAIEREKLNHGTSPA